MYINKAILKDNKNNNCNMVYFYLFKKHEISFYYIIKAKPLHRFQGIHSFNPNMD